MHITSKMSSITTDISRPTHIQGFTPAASRLSTTSPSKRGAPNLSSRPPTTQRFEGPCKACGKYGHPASRCDMLAMALFLRRYCRDRNNQETITASEACWVEHNNKFLPKDNRTPHTVLANYCLELQFMEDTMDNELDWTSSMTQSLYHRTNDSYGKLVRRFPLLSLTMALHLVRLITPHAHMSTVRVLIHPIMPPFTTGSMPFHLYNMIPLTLSLLPCLSPHLELDSRTRFYLAFRMPSFHHHIAAFPLPSLG